MSKNMENELRSLAALFGVRRPAFFYVSARQRKNDPFGYYEFGFVGWKGVTSDY